MNVKAQDTPGPGGETVLQRSARRRRENAAAKAEKALCDLAAAGKPVTFASVARAAGVSSDFLYRHPDFRGRIAQLRTTSAVRPLDGQSDAEHQADAAGSASAAVRALSAQIKKMRRAHLDELSAMRKALENAHGENLHLRRRLKLDPPPLP